MGIYDRDYERSYDTGSGWRDGGGAGGGGGFASWSVTGQVLAVLAGVHLLQTVVLPLTGWLQLPSDWWRTPWKAYALVSYGLAHGDLMHLFSNALGIFFFGRAIEQRYGRREYLLLLITAVVSGALAWTLTEVFASGGQRSVMIGASAAVATVVVLFALNYPHREVLLFLVLPVPAWLLGAAIVFGDLVGALGRSGGVAYTAHLGGALLAFLYFRYRWNLSSKVDDLVGGGAKLPSFKAKPKLRVHREEEVAVADPDDERVDAVLQKIQDRGQDSLTASERKILERASRRYQQRRNP